MDGGNPIKEFGGNKLYFPGIPITFPWSLTKSNKMWEPRKEE